MVRLFLYPRFTSNTIRLCTFGLVIMMLCLGSDVLAQDNLSRVGFAYEPKEFRVNTVQVLGPEGLSGTSPQVQTDDMLLAVNGVPIFGLGLLSEEQYCRTDQSLLILRPSSGVYFASSVKGDGCLTQRGQMTVVGMIRSLVTVNHVADKSPAADAGLHVGDILFRGGGLPLVGTPNMITTAFQNIVDHPPFDLWVGRDGDFTRLVVSLPADASSENNATEQLNGSPVTSSTDHAESSEVQQEPLSEATLHPQEPSPSVERSATPASDEADSHPFFQPLFITFLQGFGSGFGEVAYCALVHTPDTFLGCHRTQQARLALFISENHMSALIASLLGMALNPISWLLCGIAIHARTSGFGAIKLGFFVGVADSMAYTLGDLIGYGWKELDMTATLMMGILSGLMITLVVAAERFRAQTAIRKSLERSSPYTYFDPHNV